MNPPEVVSSLEDSTYEVLGGSNLMPSDDDGHTESLASVDGDTEDIQSVTDTEYSADSQASDASEAIDDTPGLPQSPIFQSVTDSNLTATQQHEEFVNPWADSLETLRVNGVFRILLVGGDDSTKPELIRKIGQALAAGGSSDIKSSQFLDGGASYNVIPISSFGNDTPPEVELIDASGVQLHVDECDDAAKTHDDIYALRVNKKTVVVKSGTAFVRGNTNDGKSDSLFKDYRLPHLAVIYSTEEPIPTWMEASRSAMEECNVPILEIPSLFPCDKILDMDPLRLNSILAVISRKSDSAPEKPGRSTQDSSNKSSKGYRSLVLEGLSRVQQSIRRPVTTDYMLFAACFLIVTCICSFLYPGASTGAQLQNGNQVEALNSALATLTGKVDSAVSSVSTIPSAVSMQPVDGKTSSTALVSTPPDKSLAAPLIHPLSPSANESHEFRTHVIGDHHIILTPPQSFVKLRRPPKIYHKVVRGSRSLDAKLTQLVDGVHAVEIPREDAYGLIELSIWTKSKPVFKQSFEHNLGSQWFKSSTYTDTAKKLLSQAKQESKAVQEMTERRLTAIQKTLPDVQKALMHRVNELTENAVALYRGTQDFAHVTASESRNAARSRTNKAMRNARALRRKLKVR